MPSNTGQDTILADNWIHLDRRAIKVAKRIDQSGSGVSNMWGHFPARMGHVIRRMRSGCIHIVILGG